MTALYSSGPVTPSMRNLPCASCWPSERHRRAVSTSSGRPTSRSNSSSCGRVEVLDDRVGDVGVDVEGGRAGRPVAGALLAADGPPRERGAVEAELRRVRLGRVHGREPPAQRVGGGCRARCRSAPAARTSRCPRRCGRRTRSRSGPWPGSAGSRCAPRPAGCGTGRTGRPAGSPRRRRPRRRRPPRTRRGTGAARRAARPSRSAWRRPSRPPPGRSGRAATAARTSRSRGT